MVKSRHEKRCVRKPEKERVCPFDRKVKFQSIFGEDEVNNLACCSGFVGGVVRRECVRLLYVCAAVRAK